MASTITAIERAAGRLVFAIQREWAAEAGSSRADQCERVMRSAQRLLVASKGGSLVPFIGIGSVSEYLGRAWINAHPWVWPHVQVLESVLLHEAEH